MMGKRSVAQLHRKAFSAAFSLLFLATSSCSLPKFVILHDPLSPEEHINLGLAYEKNGETENAIEEYTKASKETPVAFLYLGNIYFAKGESSEAEKYYRMTIRMKPDLADAYNNLAWLLYGREENLEEAMSLSRKALDLDPSNANYRDTLSLIIDRMKKEGIAPEEKLSEKP